MLLKLHYNVVLFAVLLLSYSVRELLVTVNKDGSPVLPSLKDKNPTDIQKYPLLRNRLGQLPHNGSSDF